MQFNEGAMNHVNDQQIHLKSLKSQLNQRYIGFLGINKIDLFSTFNMPLKHNFLMFKKNLLAYFLRWMKKKMQNSEKVSISRWEKKFHGNNKPVSTGGWKSYCLSLWCIIIHYEKFQWRIRSLWRRERQVGFAYFVLFLGSNFILLIFFAKCSYFLFFSFL